MSFGASASDVAALVLLAWKTVQNARNACGEHAEISRETLSLLTVLQRLHREAEKTESPINRPGETCKDELASIVSGSTKVLETLNKILQKYNTLSEEERSIRKLWAKVRFGNGHLADVADLRSKIVYYTSALSLFINMITMGSVGRVEKQMDEAGGDLKEIRLAVNGITAHLMANSHGEGSVLTAYPDDEKAVWKEFRRELVRDGFSSSVIRRHKDTIKAYVRELGSRGLLDDEESRYDDGGLEEPSQLSSHEDAGLDADRGSIATARSDGSGSFTGDGQNPKLVAKKSSITEPVGLEESMPDHNIERPIEEVEARDQRPADAPTGEDTTGTSERQEQDCSKMEVEDPAHQSPDTKQTISLLAQNPAETHYLWNNINITWILGVLESRVKIICDYLRLAYPILERRGVTCGQRCHDIHNALQLIRNAACSVTSVLRKMVMLSALPTTRGAYDEFIAAEFLGLEYTGLCLR